MKHYSRFFSNKSYTAAAAATQNRSEKKEKTESGTLPDKDYDVNKEIDSIGAFVRSGLFVLSVIFIAGAAISYGQKNLAPASNMPSAIANKKLPIYCVDTDKKQVALSFDAAWGNEDTQKILSILKKKKVHATFFMTGGWIEKYPDDVKAIQKAGHELGNHSENHKQMSTLSAEECKAEIMKPHQKVKELTGTNMTVFRPPYGDYNDTLIDAAKECNYSAIQWDVDSLDWKDYGTDSILNTVLNHKHLGNGSIILCHNGAKYTADALEALIDGLQEKGFTLVRMSELIYTENYEMDTEGRQHSISATPSTETTETR
ncbi:MAG: polysaccharide deacetylase family protein [Butyribacter sp.]|nr:polysaccharide deacetylase family protein [bacterium]MDY3854919.1 polysaccharide deacetylase family protein [Butyribacter sp.]